MLQRRADNPEPGDAGFFGVITQPSSYRNLLYLLLGLPLGTLYFSVIVTGLSLSVGLMPLALLGIPVTIGLWYVVRAFMRIERSAAVSLLGEQIDPVRRVPRSPGGMWRHFKAVIADTYGWKAMLFLVLRFPVGIFTFTLATTLVATSLGFTFAPTYMWAGDNQDWLAPWFDSYVWSFALIPIGIILTIVSLHILNALAGACGHWTRSAIG